MEWYESYGAEDTYALGEVLGRQAKAGSVYALYGDIGAGKTVFAQGFAAGLGVREPVNSPTFTIVQIYEEGRLPFYHMDAYRIADPEEMEEIGYDDYFYGKGAVMIEWASLIEDFLPPGVVSITFEKKMKNGFNYREITIETQD